MIIGCERPRVNPTIGGLSTSPSDWCAVTLRSRQVELQVLEILPVDVSRGMSQRSQCRESARPVGTRRDPTTSTMAG
jgi:hypothetical protein